MYRLLLSNISDTIFMTSDSGAFTYICPNVAEIFGYTVPEARAIGHISKLLGADFSEDGHLAAEGEIKNVECQITDKLGRPHTLLVNVKPVSIGASRRLYTCRDITERKRVEQELERYRTKLEEMVVSRTRALAQNNAQLRHEIADRVRTERALRVSEKRYRQMFFSHQAVKLLIDPASGDIVDANQAAQDFYGYPAETLKRMKITDINLLSETQVTAEMSQAETEAKGHFIFRHRLASGETRDVEVYSAPLEIEGRRLLYSIIHDITDRRQAQAILKRYTDRLEVLYQINQAILAADSIEETAQAALHRIGRLIACSRATVLAFDFEAGQAQVVAHQSRSAVSLRAGMTLPLASFGWLSLLAEGQIRHVADLSQVASPSKVEQMLYNGGCRSYLTVPLQTPGGLIGAFSLGADEPNHFKADHLHIAREVADSLAVALHQTRLHQQTRQDADIKDVLLQEVNHRVNNNLTAIIGLLTLERNRSQVGPTTYWLVLGDLIARIRGLATVHRLLSAGQWSPLSLKELVEQVITSASQALPPNHQLAVAVQPSTIQIVPRQVNNLALVINELTTNTIKYGLTDQYPGQLSVCFQPEMKSVSLEFRDNGPGYPAAVLRGEQSSVGLDLIQKLVRQGLRSEVTLHNDGGAVTTIRLARQGNLSEKGKVNETV
jgi:PAS domain S-box-containing protein